MDGTQKKQSEFFYPTNDDDLAGPLHRQLIGLFGLLLPVVVVLMAVTRPTQQLPGWPPLMSISAYYYTAAVSAFSGSLVAMGLYLITYRGYNTPDRHLDLIPAIIAGAAALVVAFFPTGLYDEKLLPSWWTKPMGVIHNGAAVVLFGCFVYMALFRFTIIGKDGLTKDKVIRNWIYRICGVAIIACLAWAGIASSQKMSFFVPESLALIFFAFAWLVKGRAGYTLRQIPSRGVHYVRHPRQFVEKVNKALGPQEPG